MKMIDATLVGTPERVLERLRVRRAAGLNVADIKTVPRDLQDTLEQMPIIGDEMIPALPESGDQ